MPDKNLTRPFWSSMRGFIAFAAAVIIIWLVALFGLPALYGKPDDVGVAGDMFGGVTALFSGLAFAGLISTLLMQRQELELQRRELELSRSEFKLQRFEATLFGLMKLLNDHVASIEIVSNSTYQGEVVQKRVAGRQFFRDAARKFPDEFYEEDPYVRILGDRPPEMKRRTVQEQKEVFRTLFESELEQELAPYMRILYGIFRHIDTATIGDDRKKMYSRIARSHLSSSEVKLVFFDCATDTGRDFRPWIEKYGLLKHLTVLSRMIT
jgi:hypothetical protein